MKVSTKQILFKSSARLLILASLLCVLFGNGLHFHTIFDHIFDHGDIHAFVHAHPSGTDHDHNAGFDDKDAHQHPTAKVDLTGTLSQKINGNASENTKVLSGTHGVFSQKITRNLIPQFIDLPPPDRLYRSGYSLSYSPLRGPPQG